MEIERILDGSVALPADVAAQVEQLKGGGLIESAVGGLHRNMDGVVGDHLNKVALLTARGDTKAERSAYMLNPDSNLLISYSQRNYPDMPEYCRGLFASVVTLDADGKPIYGIEPDSNPFHTEKGYVQVEVGDNEFGIPPSHFDVKVDKDSPLTATPDSIEMAELMAMLDDEPIPGDEDLESFLERTDEKRAELRAKIEEATQERFKGTCQGLSPETNPHVQLVVSDRDASSLADISRSLGIFPVVCSVDEFMITRAKLERLAHGNPNNLGMIAGQLCKGLGARADYVPSILTVDYPFSSLDDPDTNRPRTVKIKGDRIVNREEHFMAALKAIRFSNPIFSTMINQGIDRDFYLLDGASEEDIEIILSNVRIVQKLGAHGLYELGINPDDAGAMQNYENWLRKVKLDYMLTLYLRGLDKV